jgi:hypothetical protein
MTRKQEVRYRTGKLQSGGNCGCCIHIERRPGEDHLGAHGCRVLGPGTGRGFTVNHDGVCDKFELRRKYHGA